LAPGAESPFRWSKLQQRFDSLELTSGDAEAAESVRKQLAAHASDAEELLSRLEERLRERRMAAELDRRPPAAKRPPR
jgi:phage shock protein A